MEVSFQNGVSGDINSMKSQIEIGMHTKKVLMSKSCFATQEIKYLHIHENNILGREILRRKIMSIALRSQV